MKTKTIATVIVAVLIVGVILSLTFALSFQPHVEITSFTSTGTSSGYSYGTVHLSFVLNLTNSGIVDVENLTVTFSTTTSESHGHLINVDIIPPHDRIAEIEMSEPCYLGGLKAEETKNFMFYWPVSFGFDAPPLTATLKTNEAILDQATITIPPLPDVKITNFVCLGVWHGTKLGGLLDLFSLSYTNLGTIDVKNLTITLNTSRTNENDTDTPPIRYSYLDEYINGDTYSLESIKVNETKTFQKSYLDVGFLLIEPFSLTATLKSNGTILDQATITIPLSHNH